MKPKLKDRRKELGLTQSQVAQKASMSERVYQRYESGEQVPNAYTAQRIAEALESTVEELFPLKKIITTIL